jgi:hypothetical protein
MDHEGIAEFATLPPLSSIMPMGRERGKTQLVVGKLVPVYRVLYPMNDQAWTPAKMQWSKLWLPFT